MNHIQHFGAGALVATFGIFAMSSIATQANYFAVENTNAIYSAASANALTQAASVTDGKRPVDNFNQSARSLGNRKWEVRGIVASVTNDTIVVKSNDSVWTGKIVSDTKFPIAQGLAIQVKDVPATPEKNSAIVNSAAGVEATMPAPVEQNGISQVKVGDRVAIAGRLVSQKTLRLSMVRNFDIHPEEAKPATLGAASVSVTAQPSAGKPVRAQIRPDMPMPSPMPTPIAPVSQEKPKPGIAQPVPMPRD